MASKTRHRRLSDSHRPERVHLLDAPCMRCGQVPVRVRRSPHDACIARLPDVQFACCGHGGLPGRLDDPHFDLSIDTCYVVFNDGLLLRGNAARAAMEMLGGSPPPTDKPRTDWPDEHHGIGWI